MIYSDTDLKYTENPCCIDNAQFGFNKRNRCKLYVNLVTYDTLIID